MRAIRPTVSLTGGVDPVPSNKIGGLKTGQGLRRIEEQQEGGWRDEEAKANYKIGDELRPVPSSPGKPSRSSRWSGADR